MGCRARLAGLQSYKRAQVGEPDQLAAEDDRVDALRMAETNHTLQAYRRLGGRLVVSNSLASALHSDLPARALDLVRTFSCLDTSPDSSEDEGVAGAAGQAAGKRRSRRSVAAASGDWLGAIVAPGGRAPGRTKPRRSSAPAQSVRAKAGVAGRSRVSTPPRVGSTPLRPSSGRAASIQAKLQMQQTSPARRALQSIQPDRTPRASPAQSPAGSPGKHRAISHVISREAPPRSAPAPPAHAAAALAAPGLRDAMAPASCSVPDREAADSLALGMCMAKAGTAAAPDDGALAGTGVVRIGATSGGSERPA